MTLTPTDSRPRTRPRVLVLHGGWAGHEPSRIAEMAASILGDFEATLSEDLDLLRRDQLSNFDLLIPIWTHGELSEEREAALVEAVTGGLGLVAWHSAAGAFSNSRSYRFLVGGGFMAHPGDTAVTYSVNFDAEDPLVADLAPLTLTTEQYYLLVDPAVTVLADTKMVSRELPWLEGVVMPVAWKRTWGQGRVFYCSLGHSHEIFENATVVRLFQRAAAWARRGAKE